MLIFILGCVGIAIGAGVWFVTEDGSLSDVRNGGEVIFSAPQEKYAVILNDQSDKDEERQTFIERVRNAFLNNPSVDEESVETISAPAVLEESQQETYIESAPPETPQATTTETHEGQAFSIEPVTENSTSTVSATSTPVDMQVTGTTTDAVVVDSLPSQ